MLDANNYIGDWVAEDFSRAKIFEEYGIDFCCGGKRPLKDACDEKGIDLEEILRRLEKQENKELASINFSTLTATELCDHIEQVHHRYLKTHLPYIQTLLKKIVAAHGEEYLPLQHQFDRFVKDMMIHMEKEENEIFPKIRNQVKIKNECAVLEMEHQEAKISLTFFREFTHDYAIPSGACTTHRTALLELAALEEDMHEHVYKENHLLFPRASM